MATATEIQEFLTRYKRTAISLAEKKGIDADEAQGMLGLAVVEAAATYDPEHASKASLHTYAMNKYRGALLEAASQARYGVELDAEKALDLAALIPAAAAEDEEDEAEKVREALRYSDTKKIAERLALLPPEQRAFAMHMVGSKNNSVAQASKAAGMSERNGRYLLDKICATFNELDADAGQGCLF